VLAHELKAAIVFFWVCWMNARGASLLGQGDALVGVDAHTGARGRMQLLADDRRLKSGVKLFLR